VSLLAIERIQARLAAATTVQGLRGRSRLFLQLAAGALCLAGLLTLAGLALWTGGPAQNNGFSNVYAPYYVTGHLAGVKIPSSDQFERLFLGVRWVMIDIMLRGLDFLFGFGAAIAFFLRRRLLAVLLVSVILILNQGWNGYRNWRGFETLTPAQTTQALSLSDLSSPDLDENERTSLIFMGAQAAYLAGDPATTKGWLERLKPNPRFTIDAAHWRILLMQEWAAANGHPLAEAAVMPDISVLPSQKRTWRARLLVVGAASFLFALGFMTLAAVIGCRIRRIGLVQNLGIRARVTVPP